MKDGWVKLPKSRALVWSQLSGYVRAMGTELVRVLGHEPSEIGGDWKLAIARALELDGRDRAPFYRALDDMQAAGVLVVAGTTIQLLYTDDALASHRKRNGSTPNTQATHTGVTPNTQATCIEHASNTQATHSQHAAQPQDEISARNDSGHASQKERKKEEKDRQDTYTREGDSRRINTTRLERLFSAARKAAGHGSCKIQRSDYDRAQKACEWANEEHPDDPEGACARGFERYFASATGLSVEQGYPFWGWANDPAAWDRERRSAPRKGAPAPVSTRDEWEAMEAAHG